MSALMGYSFLHRVYGRLGGAVDLWTANAWQTNGQGNGGEHCRLHRLVIMFSVNR